MSTSDHHPHRRLVGATHDVEFDRINGHRYLVGHVVITFALLIVLIVMLAFSVLG